MSDDEEVGPQRDPFQPVGQALGLTPASQVARAALHRAQAAARSRGFRQGQAGPRRAPDQRSGAGRDGRDPALLGETVARLTAQLGWSAEISVGGVIGRWRDIVGDQVAEHCTPETFEDGQLVVRADSTSWAVAMQRYHLADLRRRLEEEVGPDVVTEIRVLGPAAPDWRRGKRTVKGRGPRDTYG